MVRFQFIKSLFVRQDDSLTHTLTLYFPSTTNVSEAADIRHYRKWLNATRREFARRFGGVTSVNATGGYLADNGDLVEEHIVLISSKASAVRHDDKEWLVEVAQLIKAEFGQEAVAIEIDGHLRFV